MSTPLLICLTPVRNEAWVLHAFLKATSVWADYIIIADQQSSDGSREIALSYPKVILIENSSKEFNEPERQKLLIEKAREIVGDKILFGFDADEILSANFWDTNDWKAILDSKPGDVFWFKWANVHPNQKEYWESKSHFPWMFHDDGIEPHGNYAKKMHSMRIPYPIDEKQMFYVNDFHVLHLAYLYPQRVMAKLRFYKFTDWELNQLSTVAQNRNYKNNYIEGVELHLLPKTYFYEKNKFEFYLFDEIDLTSGVFWFDDYLLKKLETKVPKELAKLDIWDKDFITKYHLTDNRSWLYKLLHFYLKKTENKKGFILRVTDSILKKIT